ncbi:peptide-N4-(N-acetyl-beta- glucosaminyl)asparagine amidase [Tulasnella sp. 332]|nr:peptide-N4-(N-acetyl-beta- glucosaminyl)asparagine amidase [Tulasnella sp. 332]
MNFPTPQHLLQYASSPSPSKATFRDASQDLSDERQWEKFDELFDKVFAPARPVAGPTNAGASGVESGHKKSKSLPGRFVADGGNSSSDDAAGDFSGAWKDALSRTRKTVTTTTKRRIIRHTPPALEMPASPTTPAHHRFPKTPYPNSDGEDSSDDNMPSTPTPMPSSAPRIISTSPEGLSSNLVSSSSSPSKQVVRFKPQPQKSKLEMDQPVWATATFDMPIGLPTSDIHVGYSMQYGAEKATVSWQHVTVEEIVEDGKLVREKKERKYHRTLPLPRGTKFDTVKAFLQDGVLTLAYPSRPGLNPSTVRPIEVLHLGPTTESSTAQRSSVALIPHGLEGTIQNLDRQMDTYERSDLLDAALDCMPLQDLHVTAERLVESKEVPGYEDGLADALVKWFKTWFKWADPIKCPLCDGETTFNGMGTPNAEEGLGGAGRIELHCCTRENMPNCTGLYRFPRYK